MSLSAKILLTFLAAANCFNRRAPFALYDFINRAAAFPFAFMRFSAVKLAPNKGPTRCLLMASRANFGVNKISSSPNAGKFIAGRSNWINCARLSSNIISLENIGLQPFYLNMDVVHMLWLRCKLFLSGCSIAFRAVPPSCPAGNFPY